MTDSKIALALAFALSATGGCGLGVCEPPLRKTVPAALQASAFVNGSGKSVDGSVTGTTAAPGTPGLSLNIAATAMTQSLSMLSYSGELYRNVPCTSAANPDPAALVQSLGTVTLSPYTYSGGGPTEFSNANGPWVIGPPSTLFSLDGLTLILKLQPASADLENAILCTTFFVEPEYTTYTRRSECG